MPASGVLFRAVTIVNGPREIRGARPAIGSNAPGRGRWAIAAAQSGAGPNYRRLTVNRIRRQSSPIRST